MTYLHHISMFLLLLSFPCQLQALVIDRSKRELTAVPQDVTVTVTEFILKKNIIQEINHTSFAIYPSLEKVDLSHNPSLKYIRENSFQNNPYLFYFACNFCDIVSLPANFCPCVASITEMHLNVGINPSVADTIFRYPYFEAFTSLKKVGLAKFPLKNMTDLRLPPTIKMLFITKVGLTRFPDVTASVFPILTQLRMQLNPIGVIPVHEWEQVSDNLRVFHAYGTGLSVMVDLTLKQHLEYIDISRNDLETVPDLLNMPSLTKLHLADNSRMACDRRMCWRRLWDRIRAPLTSSDDVMCMQPPELTGYRLSMVNPKLMDCGQGTSHVSCDRFY